MECRASIIIPARNAAPLLDECLAAVREQGRQIGGVEVIVVDDASTDDTAAVARRHGVQVVRSADRNPAAARNLGARLASGVVLVFFDADCVPAPGCLAALLEPFRQPDVVGVRGGYATRQRGLIARFVQLELEEKQARLARSRATAVIDTACAAYRRTVFLEAGGFDEAFPAASAEDVDLSFRLAARGLRLVYAPEARVYHRHPHALGRYLWRKARFGFFRARLYTRHPSRLRDDGYTPRLMPVQIALSGLLAVLALAAPWSGAAATASLLVAAAFLAASLPLAARAWPADRGLACCVPALLLARSLAQGAGLVAGLLALALKRAIGAERQLPTAATSSAGRRRDA